MPESPAAKLPSLRFPCLALCRNSLSLLALALLLAIPASAATPSPNDVIPAAGFVVAPYPHTATYLRLSGDGHQLNSDAMVAKIARYDIAIIPASPATELYSQRLAQIRALNPDIILLAYFPADFMWDGSQYPAGNIYGDCWRLFQQNDWWLYATDGHPFSYFGNTFDLSKPAVTTGLANFLFQRVLSSGYWDGLFLDDMCEDTYWKEAFNGQLVDENRDGIHDDQNVFDPIWKTGTDVLAANLRNLAGSSMLMSGNCAYGSKWTTMNGWMREDFPFQGDWSSNMWSTSGGYMVNEANFRSPQVNFIYSTSVPAPGQFTPSNLQFLRFGLGSTLLGKGYFIFDPRQDTASVADWWFDDYDAGGLGKGWLGPAKGPYYQQIGLLNTAEKFLDTGFESPLTTNWAPYAQIGSFSQDAGTHVEGSYSAHATVPSATAYPSQIHLQQTMSLTGRPWSITFWGRSSVPRRMWVQVQRTGSPYSIYCNQAVNLTPQWTQFQVPFSQLTTSQVNVQFQMGQDVGDVWLDDAHLKAGASSVYRRDFDNGTVLVNASSSIINVTLEKTYYRFFGRQDPATNNGSAVNSLALQGNDAALLMATPAPSTGGGGSGGGGGGHGPGGILLFAESPAKGPTAARLTLTLPEPGMVRLAVYDISGRQVALLRDGFEAAGRHSYSWNGSTSSGGAARGIYFARATAQSRSLVRSAIARLVLLTAR